MFAQVLQSMSGAQPSDAVQGVPALLLEACMQLSEQLLGQYAGLWPSQRRAANDAIATLLDAGVSAGAGATVVRRVALASLAAAAVPAPFISWAGTLVTCRCRKHPLRL